MMTYKKLTSNIFPVSCYSNLEDYHINEEQHAYYMEMRAELVRRLDQYRKEAGRKIFVLELGAGTGLLTKLLAERSGIELTVLEPDERSRLILKRV
ncbi:class I SAM-dependent methyltransferase, partial [Candidatus Uhrbacteria bacterium]|nr:class I SAM-dependent methyltransferase [Candidatus Uhrbacteria bacterium]